MLPIYKLIGSINLDDCVTMYFRLFLLFSILQSFISEFKAQENLMGTQALFRPLVHFPLILNLASVGSDTSFRVVIASQFFKSQSGAFHNSETNFHLSCDGYSRKLIGGLGLILNYSQAGNKAASSGSSYLIYGKHIKYKNWTIIPAVEMGVRLDTRNYEVMYSFAPSLFNSIPTFKSVSRLNPDIGLGITFFKGNTNFGASFRHLIETKLDFLPKEYFVPRFLKVYLLKRMNVCRAYRETHLLASLVYRQHVWNKNYPYINGPYPILYSTLSLERRAWEIDFSVGSFFYFYDKFTPFNFLLKEITLGYQYEIIQGLNIGYSYSLTKPSALPYFFPFISERFHLFYLRITP